MDPDDGELSEAPDSADSFERLLAAAVGAPPPYPVLARDTVLAERYVIERLLGVGGMGAVYLARDRVLDRPVAIKLHRTASLSERMHREAIAMARLAHPNVVTVFEVGTFEARTFVAMEYVEGETFRAWLDGARRTRGDILDVLLAAGEGLAAAHDAGLVHRDVKPENVLIGRDGRVRIGDFGLAQIAKTATGPVDVPIASDTATGAVVGTPAYMAPEQIAGGEIDARTDQFAFCVAGWEALAGTRPFTGATTGELRAAIARGVPRPPRSRLPGRFRRVLARGLAAEPEARWPSLRALLAALRAARRRPRVLAAAAVVALGGLAGTASALWPEHDAIAACDREVSAFDREVPVGATDALVSRLASAGGPYAGDRARVLALTIDNQRTPARAVTRAACRARATRTWSAELAEASAQCLTEHARIARELLLGEVWPADGVGLLDVTSRLPDAASCGDARLLAGWRSLGSTTATVDEVITARARIVAAVARLYAGQVAPAAAIHAELAGSPGARSPAVRGRLDLLRAKLHLATGEYEIGERMLTDAYFAARASDDGELALQIVGELVTFSSVVRRDAEATERWIQNALADAQRDRARHPRAAAQVVLHAATAAASAGDGDLALERAQLVAEILGDVMASDIGRGLHGVRFEALAALGRIDEALAESERHLENIRRELGDRHPEVALALSDRAALLLEAYRAEDAAAILNELREILDTEVSSSAVSLATVELNVGATLLSVEDPRARTYLERARARWVAAYGEHHPDVALADTNLAVTYLDAGDPDTATALLRRATAVQERLLGPDHMELASGLYNLAVAERLAGQYDEALATARRTAAILEKRQAGAPRHITALGHVAMIANLAGKPTEALAAADAALAYPSAGGEPQGPAWARLEAARALIALGRAPARVRTLLDEARAGYVEAKLTARVAEIDALRRTVR